METPTNNKQGSTFCELMGYALDACTHFRAPADTAICVATDGHSVQHLVGDNSVSATIALAQAIQAYLMPQYAGQTAVRVKAPEVPTGGVSENKV